MSFPQLSALALELLPRSMSTISPTVFHGFVLEHGRIPPLIFVVHIHFTGANGRGSTGFLRNDLLAVKVSGSSSERTNFSTGKRLRGTRRKHSRFGGEGVCSIRKLPLCRERLVLIIVFLAPWVNVMLSLCRRLRELIPSSP